MRLTRSVRRISAITVIALLSIIAVVLSILALSHTRTSSASEEPIPPTSTPVASPTPSAIPSAEPTGSPVDRTKERFLAFSGESGWRATAGSCEAGAPVLQRLDGGGEWVDIVVREHEVRQIASLDAYPDGAEFVAAVDADCTATALRTFSAGAAWAPRPDSLAQSRYVDLHDVEVIHTRSGELAAPCATPTGLRARGDVVALVCDEQAWTRTGDEWTALDLAGVKALTIDDAELLVGYRSEECDGLAVSRVSGTTNTALGCAEGVDSTLPVAIAQRGTNAVVWASEEIVEVTAQ